MNVTTTLPLETRAEPDTAVQRVADALADARWDFRTIDGIARDTGLSTAEVEAVLNDHPELFRRSFLNSAEGKPLYTMAAKPEKVRERLAELRSFLAAHVQ